MAQLRRRTKPLKGELTELLFAPTPSFRILELGERDAKKKTDGLNVLRELLLANESMYPGIGRWYSEKVIPGLKNFERLAYVAFENETPIASAVLKRGERTKFCHLRIHENFRDLDLGQMFFTQMTLEARGLAKEIHFTLPEGLWYEKVEFFQSFGFTAAVKAPHQYRNGEAELSCSAPLPLVWSRVLQKLPRLLTKFSPGGYSLSNKLVMSMRPEHADRVFSRRKQVEFRKKFSLKWCGYRAVVYGTQPLGSLVGEVTMRNITCDTPKAIWDSFGAMGGCSQQEFAAYVGSSPNVYAIELSDVTPYISPIGLAHVSHLINEDLRPPQSFRDVRIDANDAWVRAVSVASMLHSKFSISRTEGVKSSS
jgi:predicted transcriptional regulator